MQRLTDTEVGERRSARWARSWASPRPLVGSERGAVTTPRKREEEIQRLVEQDVYGLCPGWWVPVFLVLAVVWMGILTWVAFKWAF